MKPGDAFNPRFEACGFHPEEIVSRRRDLTDGQKWLYDRLVGWARSSDGERANEHAGEVWRSQENLAFELGKSTKQIGRDLAKLESEDLLGHRKRDGRKSNTYFFRFHPDFEQTSTSPQQGLATPIEQTPVSVQRQVTETPGSDLNGHLRPVRSHLNGHPRPPNQQDLNQQSHTHQESGQFEKVAKLRTVPTERARDSCKNHAKHGSERENEFSMRGWESSEEFEIWWMQLVCKHPNKNRNGAAKTLATKLVRNGTLTRTEFEKGYAALTNSDRWREQNGRFVPNLWQLLDDRLWKHASASTDLLPIPAGSETYEGAEDYLRRQGIQ